MKLKTLAASIVLVFSATAKSQTTVIVQPDQWAFLRDAGKQDAERAGRSIADLLDRAIRGKQVTKFVFVIQCERVVKAAASYADGSNKVLTVDVPVDRADLAATQAVNPRLQVVELGCNK